jgi:hypothetical protein
VASRDGDVEVFKKPNQVIVIGFYLLLEQDHNHFIYLLDCLVDNVFIQVGQYSEFGLLDASGCVVLRLSLRHALELPVLNLRLLFFLLERWLMLRYHSFGCLYWSWLLNCGYCYLRVNYDPVLCRVLVNYLLSFDHRSEH